jgi:serine/threonine protein kinase/Tol biopolymer transport system component
MPLAAGTLLGQYEVVEMLGWGGMGEVYCARDTKLDRPVAIKVLREECASDPERLRRFEQEARIVSSLNHPNIVTIFDIDQQGSMLYIAMEYVEGKTLREMVASEPLPLKTLLPLATQIAEGLAKAHSFGVVHRDLKPGNLMVSHDGLVKILDFGLAKLIPQRSDVLSEGSTVDKWSEFGTPPGTAPYMSPEQAAGRPLDYHSDQFALGSVLYVMATGKPAFHRETVPQTLADIIEADPEPIASLNPKIPPPLRWMIERCLAKDPQDRYVSTADLARELQDLGRHLSEISSEPASSPSADRSTSRPPLRKRVRLGPLAALGLLALGLLIGFAAARFMTQGKEASSVRIAMEMPNGLQPSFGYGPSLAISPEGGTLAFVLGSGTTTRLFVKRPEDLEVMPMAGTEGARTPFFSPRGQWIAFFDEDDRQLKKLSLSGGEPVAVADTDSRWGAAWTPDGTIVFTLSYGGLVRVSENGGKPEPVTNAEETYHIFPSLLPGGKVVLFTILPADADFDEASIAAVPVAGGAPKVVLESASFPHYAPTGHLVFVQGGHVLAAPFDQQALVVTGPPVELLEGVWTNSYIGYAEFTFSETGTLLYISGGSDPNRATLVSVDRNGTSIPLVTERRPYRVPRVSPDGRQLAFAIGDQQVDIWAYDLSRRSFDRLTDSASWDAYPLWQPGMNAMAFSSMREGPAAIYRIGLRSETVEKLVTAEHSNYPGSWSPDGKLLAYWQENPETGLDIWVYSVETASQEPFLRTAYNESAPEFSPDGRFIAYESNETGQQLEVYIRPYPEVNPSTRISTDGGRSPRWSADGRELFYLVSGKLMVVDIETEPNLAPSAPRELFQGPYDRYYDPAPDGQSFVMIREMEEGDPPLRFNFIANWFEELRHLAPTRQ